MELLPTELNESNFTKSCYLLQNSLVYNQKECLEMELLSTWREGGIEKWLKWIFVSVIVLEHHFEALSAMEIGCDFCVFLSRGSIHTIKKSLQDYQACTEESLCVNLNFNLLNNSQWNFYHWKGDLRIWTCFSSKLPCVPLSFWGHQGYSEAWASISSTYTWTGTWVD